MLERKLIYAREYLAAVDIVDPGISHNRGMTLWEIHAATSFLANKRFAEERLSPVRFIEMLSECLEAVREAKFSLQFNKEGSNEAEMRRAACEAEAAAPAAPAVAAAEVGAAAAAAAALAAVAAVVEAVVAVAAMLSTRPRWQQMNDGEEP